MAVLRISSQFVSESNEEQPNKRVWVKLKSADSNIFESMLFKMLIWSVI